MFRSFCIRKIKQKIAKRQAKWLYKFSVDFQCGWPTWLARRKKLLTCVFCKYKIEVVCKSVICRRLFVELEGFEPSSKRGTNELSTCVVSDWFSSVNRPGRPICTLASKISASSRGETLPISDLPAPPYRSVSEKGQSGDVSSLQLLRR